ncbi:hypothetical protein H310_09696 [Aphanomyces invadans]|uniref:DUF7769 domain-containing protein n=1 Tax=Aphanomyces invadans TaxID=157072 RepID=A0A024TUR0_9STRA|nr:hypothetical protein H310_09696 [Aphanomyces invadans]ETV97361.1 hypothetical protein H310_09696 [Aphanomyces invadans]|eukprot:XP_008874069.1 hypothetical protein H310_09696 [Aphanomyces invadans]
MKFRRLTCTEKIAIYAVLLHNSSNGKPRYGDIKHQAALYNVSERTVQRVWTKGQENRPFTTPAPRQRKQTDILDLQTRVSKLPATKKMDIRTMAEALQMPKSTLHDAFAAGVLVRKHSSLKPLLSDENKAARKQYAYSFVHLNDGHLKFDPMLDRVFLDEKWFYLRKIKNKFYLAPWEDVPTQSTKNKRHIPSVMFLTAVARPRMVDGVLFDGKLGIWPFVETVAAQRRSHRREAGTLETKTVSVTKATYKNMLIKETFPAIFEKFPCDFQRIIVQHDNAKPHAVIWTQPANSPDLNILDLGFFNSIQSLQHKMTAFTVDELIGNVKKAFTDIPAESLENVFYTLQSVMECILETDGSNKYKLKHIGKAAKRRSGDLEETLTCSVDTYLAARIADF